jgi:large subunit ribosomal protein L7/L12
MTSEKILDAIDEMPVKDLYALVKALEEKYDVSAQAAVAVAAAPAAGGGDDGGGAAALMSVILTSPGQQKVQLIKKIKEITGKGLKECKEIVDNLPAVLGENMGEDDAMQLKAQIEEAGGEVELK